MSGTGKSTSIHKNEELGIIGLNPKETFVINVAGKPLPFKGSKKIYTPLNKDGGNYIATSDYETILKTLDYISKYRGEIKNIIIDDVQYLLGFQFMEMALDKGFDRFTIIAKNFADLIFKLKNLRDDIKVFALTHAEEQRNDFEVTYSIKTVGKLITDKITPEGLFTTLLYSIAEYNDEAGKVKYSFVTNKYGRYPAKSPYGMFDEILINNDLGYVAKKLDEYYDEE